MKVMQIKLHNRDKRLLSWNDTNVHQTIFVLVDFEREVKCLRKWLREMESRLQPLSFRVNWTLPELEEKAVEHMVSSRFLIVSCLHSIIR